MWERDEDLDSKIVNERFQRVFYSAYKFQACA